MFESINGPFKMTTKESWKEVMGIKCVNGFDLYI